MLYSASIETSDLELRRRETKSLKDTSCRFTVTVDDTFVADEVDDADDPDRCLNIRLKRSKQYYDRQSWNERFLLKPLTQG